MRKENSTNYRNETDLIANCPLAAAMALVGGRWKMLLIYYVARGLNGYAALQRTLPGISGKMLYQQLRELERDHLISRLVAGRKVTYAPTGLGASLVHALAELETWSRVNRVGAQMRPGVQASAACPAR